MRAAAAQTFNSLHNTIGRKQLPLCAAVMENYVLLVEDCFHMCLFS